jgi:hypothetical protein
MKSEESLVNNKGFFVDDVGVFPSEVVSATCDFGLRVFIRNRPLLAMVAVVVVVTTLVGGCC